MKVSGVSTYGGANPQSAVKKFGEKAQKRPVNGGKIPKCNLTEHAVGKDSPTAWDGQGYGVIYILEPILSVKT